MKTYAVSVNGEQFEVRTTTAAEAARKAIAAYQDGREEPKEVKVVVEAQALPAVRKVGSVEGRR